MDKQTQELIEEAVGRAVQVTAEHLSRTFLTMETAQALARDAVPASLRDLDRMPGSGNVLKLGMSGAEWGTVESAKAIPDGTEELPHLKWTPGEEEEPGEWEIAMIVPDGTSETPHLVWIDDKWTAGMIEGLLPPGTGEGQLLRWNGSSWSLWDFDLSEYLPDGTSETPHLIWDGEWTVGLITGLPTGGLYRQVLQRDGDGNAVWDWTRWV